MSKRPSVSRAVKAYEEFSGHKPQKVTRRPLDEHDVAGWKMGPAVGVAYEAHRDGKTQRYFHEFKKAARPDLVASDDGRKLYFTGGRYKVTERGIEDMPQLFVVNPSSRRKAAKGKSPMRRRRRHTAVRRRRRATRQVAVFRTNPIRRRRRRSTVKRYARNPIRRRRMSVRRYRRNPIRARRAVGGAVNFGKMILPAAGIGLGAVGSEIIMGYLPIPAQFKTGVARHVTKGVVGIATGLVLGKLLKQRRLGNFFALGAVAIAVHDAVKEVIAKQMPSIPFGQYVPHYSGALGGMGYSNPAGVSRIGQFVPPIGSSFGGASQAHGGGGETNFAV